MPAPKASESSRSPRSSRSSGSAGLDAVDRRHLMSAALPIGAVLLTVLLGALLQADPGPAGEPSTAELPVPERIVESVGSEPIDRPAEPAPSRAIVPAEEPPAEQAAERPRLPAPTPPADADPLRQRLETRAEADLDRLTPAVGQWTLQFLVACDASNVDRQLRAVGGLSEVFLVPTELDGRKCYRLCYGRYASRGQAVAEMQVPGALRAITASPRPLAIAEAL